MRGFRAGEGTGSDLGRREGASAPQSQAPQDLFILIIYTQEGRLPWRLGPPADKTLKDKRLGALECTGMILPEPEPGGARPAWGPEAPPDSASGPSRLLGPRSGSGCLPASLCHSPVSLCAEPPSFAHPHFSLSVSSPAVLRDVLRLEHRDAQAGTPPQRPQAGGPRLLATRQVYPLACYLPSPSLWELYLPEREEQRLSPNLPPAPRPPH